MTLYKNWHNFILYANTDRVNTEGQRLNTSRAIRFKPHNASELLLYSDEEMAQRGVLQIKEDFVEYDDEFEAIQINPTGHVTI